MNILEQITEEQIAEWMIEKMKSENIDGLSANASVYPDGSPGVYWTAHRRLVCKLGSRGEGVHGAIRQFKTSDEHAKELREKAARLLKEAEELEKA